MSRKVAYLRAHGSRLEEPQYNILSLLTCKVSVPRRGAAGAEGAREEAGHHARQRSGRLPEGERRARPEL